MKQIIENFFQLFTCFILATALIACSGSGGDPGGPRNPKADLAGLMIPNINSSLENKFKPELLDYTATVNFSTASIRIIPEVLNPGSTVTINGQLVNTGSPSEPVTLDPGDNNMIDIVVTAADASISRAYTINVTRLNFSSFTSKVGATANVPKNNDVFGTQISLSGDTLAVGVPSTLSTEAGSVYIFKVTNDGSMIYKATIVPSNADNGDKFGNSVSLSGDTLIVGAPFEDSKAIGINGDKEDEDIIVDGTTGETSEGNIGAAYIYTRSPGTFLWSEQAYLKPSSTVKNIHRNIKFGSAVAIDGDTAIVSAEFEKSNATGIDGDIDDRSLVKAGAVYVFTRNGINWSQQAYIKASNTNADDRFGGSVALSGNTLAVGARFEDSSTTGIDGSGTNNNAGNSGAVYLFNRSGVTWSQEAYIKASNTNTEDQFGFSVALDGNTLAVGTKNEDSYTSGVATDVPGAEDDNSVSNSGAVYIFTRTSTTWSQQAYLKSANPQIAGNFGWSVALSGDMLAVGAVGEEFGSGTVHFFTRNGSDWSQQNPIRSLNPGSNFHFGHSLQLINGALAASAADENGKKGAVYMMK